MAKRAKRKEYWEMNTAELAEATREFDQDFAFLKGRPLTQAEKALHERALRRGRPRVGQGAEKIRVSIERGLLAEADAYARKRGISRSELIAEGLKTVIGRKPCPLPGGHASTVVRFRQTR
jgi:hypothetical protein